MSNSDVKRELRARYRRERKERYVEHNFEYLATSEEFKSAHVIASYISYGDEPDTRALNNALLSAGKTLILPRIHGEVIEWVQWNGKESSLKKYKHFLEPVGEVFTEEIDLVVVPALRIDRRGIRLGQGGGFYDRALPGMKAWKIGFIHPDEISGEDLPCDEWDIALDAAATPDLVLRFT